MYEEEEEELPSQYKNLNAHLQTGSTDFDARLQAYLANAVAFRKALSGVTKSRDKADNVDFVNTRQLADHQALFPKHSDAWKDVMIPKARQTTSSPFLPQDVPAGPRKVVSSPYNPKSSGLSSRRMSATMQSHEAFEALNSIGTLRASDLKPRTTVYRPAARHPSLPQPKIPTSQQSRNVPTTDDNLESAGINYASLDQSSLSSSTLGGFSDSPFSSVLPANTLDMLLPWNQPINNGGSVNFDNSFLYDTSLFHPKPEDTIDATLLAPQSAKTMPTSMTSEYNPQLLTSWPQQMFKESSANRKLTEDSMWGNFIDDTSAVDAWDWSTAC